MKKLIIFSLMALFISGCYSDIEINEAKKVITALPTEIEGCTFLGDLDNHAFARIENARFNLKMMASKIGATHIVETQAYATPLAYKTLGVSLSGRAYKCPIGKGPLVEDPKKLAHYDFSKEQLLYESMEDDDPIFSPFFRHRPFLF